MDSRSLDKEERMQQQKKWISYTNKIASHQSASMTQEERRMTVEALMFLTEKRDKTIKG
jgi:hypothetical protein